MLAPAPSPSRTAAEALEAHEAGHSPLPVAEQVWLDVTLLPLFSATLRALTCAERRCGASATRVLTNLHAAEPDATVSGRVFHARSRWCDRHFVSVARKRPLRVIVTSIEARRACGAFRQNRRSNQAWAATRTRLERAARMERDGRVMVSKGASGILFERLDGGFEVALRDPDRLERACCVSGGRALIGAHGTIRPVFHDRGCKSGSIRRVTDLNGDMTL